MKYILLTLCIFISLLSSAQLNLKWQDIGPDNMGGTITSLQLDKRDPTRRTLYAGALGGGIWKTTNGGDWWSFIGCIGNYAVSCITQSADGTIFFGTGTHWDNGGSSFSAAHAGNGIYKLDAQDNIIHLSSTTLVTPFDKWIAVNRIAVNPNNADQIIAATGKGLYKSFDAGVTWDSIEVPSLALGRSALDVKWAVNGNLVFAAVGEGENLARSLDGGITWERITAPSKPGFPAVSGRIEIAIAPSNPNTAYISVATSFGTTYGVWKTSDAGNTWDTIATKNSYFDPFSSNAQGWYDNAIAVSPVDPDKIFVGGVSMYTYSPSTGMNKVTKIIAPYIDSTSFLDQFGYVFNDLNPDEAYFYSDKGIYKSTDANVHFSSPTFYDKQAGLNARDFYSVAASKSGKVMGGSGNAQGTFITTNHFQNFHKLNRGFGAFCEFSHLDTNYLFVEKWFGTLLESNNGGALFYSHFDTNIDPAHEGGPSRCGGGSNAPFVAPFLLYETKSAFNNKDSVLFVASANHQTGDTIVARSKTAQTDFKYPSPVALNTGDTLKVPDAVISRLFLTTYCGVWMKLHAVNNLISIDWFRISKAIVANCYVATRDGNTLYFGTNNGRVYRISGLNFANYTNWDMSDSLTSAYSTVPAGSVEGLAIDPNNDSILICTIADNYLNQPNVYKSIDAGQTWSPLQAAPSGIPAYTCVIDANNSNNYFVGTEHGIWSSADAGATWNPDNGDMCDVPVYRLRQLPLLQDHCMVLYAATNARGLWRSFTLTPAGCDISVDINEPEKAAPFSFKLYPNPASSFLNIEFELTKPQAVQINVFDIQGRKLQSLHQQFDAGKQTVQIKTASLASGFYFVQFESNGSSLTHKFTVTE